MSILLWFIYLIIGLLGTGIVIFIHELGHYAAARINHVSVEILSFGFGKCIWSHMGKNTEFRISLIPFGGYCRMGGAEDLTVALRNNEKKIHYAEEGSLFAIHPLKKFIIYLSGPVTNILLAFVLFILVSLIPVERVSNEAIITPITAYQSLFEETIPQASIQKGDLVIEADGKEIKDYEDLESYLLSRNGEDVTLLIERNNEKKEVIITPTLIDGSYRYGITNLIEAVIARSESDLFNDGDRIIECNGKKIEYNLDLYEIEGDEYTITLENTEGETHTVTLTSSSFPFAWKSGIRKAGDAYNPIKKAYERTITYTKRTAIAITKLMTLQLSEALQEISGPFSSASNMGRISVLSFKTSTSSGVRTALYLLAIVSISIAIGNLIPIPTFDGGQMLICVAEIIYHRPLRPKAYMILHIAGLVLAWTLVIVMNSFSLLSSVLQ